MKRSFIVYINPNDLVLLRRGKSVVGFSSNDIMPGYVQGIIITPRLSIKDFTVVWNMVSLNGEFNSMSSTQHQNLKGGMGKTYFAYKVKSKDVFAL